MALTARTLRDASVHGVTTFDCGPAMWTLTGQGIVGGFFPAPPAVVRLVGEEPDWWGQFTSELQGVLRLPDGWDSYGGRRLNEKAAIFGLQLLSDVGFGGPAPQLTPTPDGDLRMEWTRGDDELVITVTADGDIHVLADADDDVVEHQLSILDSWQIAGILQDFIR